MRSECEFLHFNKHLPCEAPGCQGQVLRASTLFSLVEVWLLLSPAGDRSCICRGRARTIKAYKRYTPEELRQWIPELIAQNKLYRFYISKAWIHLREDVMQEQHYECQMCKARGIVTSKSVAADQEGRNPIELVVHHIKPVRKRPDLALDRDNLMVLCPECHYLIHHPEEKKKWDDEKW